jgi:molybdenum cofactor guanylyltransferase
MGCDKALLPHPAGGTWLEGSLRRLEGLGVPVTLLTRHPQHLRLAAALAPALTVPLEAIKEPPPWEGPLLALGRLMEQQHPGQALLLCPVDMPWLEQQTLQDLVEAAAVAPLRIHAAHDGTRLQPLLGIYPADATHRNSLRAFIDGGGRSLQRWLEQVGFDAVPLPAEPLRNCNRPGEVLGEVLGEGPLGQWARRQAPASPDP